MDLGLATLITAVIAAVLSLLSVYFSYQSNKKTTFINTITTERIKWMSEIRENVSKLCSNTYRLSVRRDISNRQEKLTEVDRLIGHIRLLLNPKEHEEILKLLDGIPEYFNKSEGREARDMANKIFGLTTEKDLFELSIANIIFLSQELLKEEWEKERKDSSSKIQGPKNDPLFES